MEPQNCTNKIFGQQSEETAHSGKLAADSKTTKKFTFYNEFPKQIVKSVMQQNLSNPRKIEHGSNDDQKE